MPGSIESTSPDQRTFKVPPCLAGDLLAVVVCCCAPPQPAAKSAAASDTEIRDLERAIASTDRLKRPLLDCAKGPLPMFGPAAGVQPWMPGAARDSDACLWHV